MWKIGKQRKVISPLILPFIMHGLTREPNNRQTMSEGLGLLKQCQPCPHLCPDTAPQVAAQSRPILAQRSAQLTSGRRGGEEGQRGATVVTSV